MRNLENQIRDKALRKNRSQDAHWNGGCACGEVRYAYVGEPVLSLKCHCLDCQAWSGDSAMIWGWADGFQLTTGNPSYSATTGGSGKRVQRGACPSCGCPVAVTIELLPSVVGILAGSLDEPERFSPEFEIWTKRAPAWDLLDPSLQQFEAGFNRDVITARLRR